MSDKQPMQADGGGTQPGKGTEIEGQLRSGGQSAGDAYPDDAPSAEEGGFLSEVASSGAADPKATTPASDPPAPASEVSDRAS